MLTLAEAVDDGQTKVFGSFPTVKHPRQGEFRTVAPPLQMSGHALDAGVPAPELGADTVAVLREAGLPEEEIALLVAAASR